ncbi:MAG TPA: PAS domain S-box protein [Woeseiaceae bacterium]|nr:PAS domain S-box protein [Woeseiaceae bacterium]
MKKPAKIRSETTQLTDRRRFTETLLNNLPGMAYRCANDRPWTMVFVSGGCEALTGHKPEFVANAGFGWADLVHADDLEATRAAVQAAVTAGEQFDVQYRIIDKFGQEKWVREQGCGVDDDTGRARMLEGYIDDITSIKNAALALDQTEKFYVEEVRQRHERLNVTFDNAPIGIVTYRHGGTFERVNRAFCAMTGYSASELNRMTVVDLTDPDYRDDTVTFMAKAQRGEIDTYSQQSRYVRKDGSVVEVRVVNAVTHDAAGQPSLIISQVADLTRQLKAQSEIRRQHEQLAHADRLHMLGEMATGMAHEINQPLTAISLFAQTGKRLFEAGEFDRLQEIFDKLSQHSRRAGAIVERIQDMGRHKRGTKKTVDLNELIEDVVVLAEVDARTNDIDIKLDLARDLPSVMVDVVQIHQVALNLLRNGMDAMRLPGYRNGNTITVATLLRDDGFLEVAVTDSGSGIADELADRLFDPFLTTKSTGLGMGLPISKAIITAHGGQLTFRNNETSGATFTFTLPAMEKGVRDG